MHTYISSRTNPTVQLLASLEKKIKVDFFKVPHHGSLTSSSNNLLKILDYDYVICMSGYKNTFGFPNINVIKRYDEDKLYLTSDKNTIVFRKAYYNKELKYVTKVVDVLE